jgi:hypothetical protein
MLEVLERPEAQRRVGRYAWVMAWVGLVVGQLHALARFATEDGKEDLELATVAAWAEPASEWLSSLLTWGDPDLVYVTYGKIWFPVFVAFTLAAFAVHRRRSPRGFEKWVWRVVLAGYVGACLATFLDYWTQWTGDYNVLFDVGWIVTLPAFLVTMVGSTVLGTTLLVKRFRPWFPALLLAGTLPLAFFVILQFTSMGSAALPIMFAFGLLGRRIAREADRPAPARDEPVGGLSWPASTSG